MSVAELPDIRAGRDLWMERANVDTGSHDRNTSDDNTLAHLVTPLASTSQLGAPFMQHPAHDLSGAVIY